jgi:hypothetical protein
LGGAAEVVAAYSCPLSLTTRWLLVIVHTTSRARVPSGIGTWMVTSLIVCSQLNLSVVPPL